MGGAEERDWEAAEGQAEQVAGLAGKGLVEGPEAAAATAAAVVTVGLEGRVEAVGVGNRMMRRG